MTVLGAVLAGGQASRFGSDKALALLDGQPLVEHSLDALRPHVAALVVVGRDALPYPRTSVPCVPDAPTPGLGPLGGIAGALVDARARGHAAVLTIACDTPALPDGLVEALFAQHCAYAAESPTVGLWPASLAGPLLDHLHADGDRSIRRWAASVGAAAVLPGLAVRGANTPAELAALRGVLRR